MCGQSKPKKKADQIDREAALVVIRGQIESLVAVTDLVSKNAALQADLAVALLAGAFLEFLDNPAVLSRPARHMQIKNAVKTLAQFK